MNANQPETLDDVSISELYHENSKHQRSDARVTDRIITVLRSPLLQGMMASAYKRYPLARRTALAHDLPAAVTGFDEAVLSRRSVREFGEEALNWSDLSKLAQFAGGITGFSDLQTGDRQYFRAAPSAGGLYPVEMYVFAQRVSTLPAGLYHYHPVENCLELLCEKDYAPNLKNITFTAEAGQAGAVFAMTGIPLKSRVKYAERGYRFMLLEAGHIAQNLLLAANSLRLAAFAIGGFIDDELDRMLGIDGLDEVSLYLVAVGKRLDAQGDATGLQRDSAPRLSQA
jgi:SagB-type dehydrogenase family enzyme